MQTIFLQSIRIEHEEPSEEEKGASKTGDGGEAGQCNGDVLCSPIVVIFSDIMLLNDIITAAISSII